uniref:AMP-binding_C domain-containing protein n=1 Tax=Parastrongyloides trichosuri TaxID=131310 RepID=A0A0N4Z9J3_PARTI
MEIQNPFQISWDNIPHNTFSDFFFSSITKYGGSLAMMDHETGKQWRYSEIKDWTDKCVLRLKEIGIVSSSRVALITTTTVEVIFIHLACSIIGATVVAISGHGTIDDIWSYVDASEATHAICETSLLSKVEDVRKKATLRGMGRIKTTKTLDEVLCDGKIENVSKPSFRQTQRSISSATIDLPNEICVSKDEECIKESHENSSCDSKTSSPTPFLMLCPSDVECIIREHPGIDDCAVVGRPDHVSGECPAAFVVKNHAYPLLSTAEVRQHVAGQIATFKELRGGVFFISEIPRSLCGKVIRRQLKGFWDRERQALGNKDITPTVVVGVPNGAKPMLAKRMSMVSVNSTKNNSAPLNRKQSDSKVPSKTPVKVNSKPAAKTIVRAATTRTTSVTDNKKNKINAKK